MFAEWEKQQGIVLIYPHIFCAFYENLAQTQACYDTLLAEILKVEDVYLILHPDDKNSQQHVQNTLASFGKTFGTCYIYECRSNDVWARDSIAISIKNNNLKYQEFANFGFNGWGLKYPANLDNQLNQQLYEKKLFNNMIMHDLILEGGSIDCNKKGVLLTNTQCLLESNRNPYLSKNQIEEKLKNALKVNEVLWLNHGSLEGDDTDSHIDTLARFIKDDTIAYIQCNDPLNLHFKELHAMEEELKIIAQQYNFQLVPLPFCEYKIFDETNNAIGLPASYVNFLFLNENNLLVPVYNKPTDAQALQTLQNALPNFQIIGINCEALIRQHGSLHCISMQIH